MTYEDVRSIVDRAAELLPEPPRSGDLDGRARWEALMIDTGRQLARVLDADAKLLRSLLGEAPWLPVACRQRRGLLLRLALCSTLDTSKAAAPGTGPTH